MPAIRIKDAAVLLGVSDDTVRRWIDGGTLTSFKDESGRKVIAGDALAEFARDHAVAPPDPLGVASSARNRFVGLVTKVTADRVMAAGTADELPVVAVGAVSVCDDAQPATRAAALNAATAMPKMDFTRFLLEFR